MPPSGPAPALVSPLSGAVFAAERLGRVKRSVSGPVAHGGEPDQRERQLAAQVALPTQRWRFASLSTSIDNARRCVAKIRRADIA
jgi:hypothetical protein